MIMHPTSWRSASTSPTTSGDVDHRYYSQTIPLPRSHLTRTQSEVQLHEDMAAAEYRDLCMFYRVVNGIRERQLSNNFAGDEMGGVDINGCHNTMVRQFPLSKQLLEAVTPYQSSQEASPIIVRAPRPDDHLGTHLPFPDANPLVGDGDDGWSISGFDDAEQPARCIQVPIVEADDGTEEDEVFDMDL